MEAVNGRLTARSRERSTVSRAAEMTKLEPWVRLLTTASGRRTKHVERGHGRRHVLTALGTRTFLTQKVRIFQESTPEI